MMFTELGQGRVYIDVPFRAESSDVTLSIPLLPSAIKDASLSKVKGIINL